MPRPREIAEFIREGKTPDEIAADLGLTIQTVMGYLHRAVGEGLLRRSDIYFSVPPERRTTNPNLSRWYNESQHAIGDMYEDIRDVELTLHEKIREALVQRYGNDEAGWWRQGVPEEVRVKCQERRERDPDDPCPPFCYSDLLDLSKIIEKRWSLLQDIFPDYAAQRDQLRKYLQRLNRIRNNVMHPVRNVVPSEADFDFVRGLKATLCRR